MNTPTAARFADLLPGWTLRNIVDGVAFTSPCKRVNGTLRLENLVFGKGRRALRKTEWVLREQGVPGFDGIGNADVWYFVRALEQSVRNADACERAAAAAKAEREAQRNRDAAAIADWLRDSGMFR